MYCISSLNKSYIIFSVLLIVVSLLDRRITILGADYIVFSGLLISFVLLKSKNLFVPKGYFKLLGLFTFLLIINAFISPYIPPIIYWFLGTLVTYLPFVFFIISYNIKFSDDGLSVLIDSVIKTIFLISIFVYVESFLSGTFKFGGKRFFESQIFMTGFRSSIFNQALILSFFRYFITRKKQYLIFIYFFITTIMLTFQIKAIFGMLIIIFFYFLLTYRDKIKIISATILSIGLISIILVKLPGLSEKIDGYSKMYDFTKKTSNGIARVESSRAAISIANDFMPLGSGQGTFGSIPVNMIYNQVYYDYGLAHVYGLAMNSRENYKQDTFWATILGENGYLGLVLYIVLIFYPIIAYTKYKGEKNKIVSFLLLTSPLCMSIESIALAIPARFAFIVIYSGVNVIILRKYTRNELVNVKIKLS